MVCLTWVFAQDCRRWGLVDLSIVCDDKNLAWHVLIHMHTMSCIDIHAHAHAHTLLYMHNLLCYVHTDKFIHLFIQHQQSFAPGGGLKLVPP